MAKEQFVVFDLGDHAVSGAVFSRASGDQLVLEKYQTSELLADPAADSTRLDQVAAAVGELKKGLKLGKEPVRYAISTNSVFTRFVTLPPLEVDQLDQIVKFEAQQQAPFPLETATWDYQTLGDPEDIEIEVALVAIKEEELDQINNAVRQHAIETNSVDLAPMAVYNSFRYNYPDVDQPVVIIDIGNRMTNLIYSEGPKVFVRSINNGARDVTAQISREFGISFMEAEARKNEDGFVALGGAYADHEDPEISAMSKVIRNTLTRLHSEVVRTNNFYRSNQGGTPPVMAFISGQGAGLPYLADFFSEKLRIPVEHYDALRNITVGSAIDEAVVAPQRHALGEVVGLGLRSLGNSPMEIDLIPSVVKKERDIARRAPYLWAAGFTAAVIMAASGLYFQQASSYANTKVSTLQSEESSLKRFDDQIAEQTGRLEDIEAERKPYTDVIIGRVFWINIFRDLNRRFVDDQVWFTELQPLASGEALLDQACVSDDTGVVANIGTVVEQDLRVADEGEYMIDTLRLLGLYRDNERGSQVVYEYFNRLKDSGYFDIPEDAEPSDFIVRIEAGTGGDKFAWEFQMELPLPSNRQIPFTK